MSLYSILNVLLLNTTIFYFKFGVLPANKKILLSYLMITGKFKYYRFEAISL